MRNYAAREIAFDGDRATARAHDVAMRNQWLTVLFVLTALLRVFGSSSMAAMWVMLIALVLMVAVGIAGTATRVIEFDESRKTIAVGHRGMLAEPEEYEVERRSVDQCFVRQLDEWRWGWFLRTKERESMLCVITDEYDAKKLQAKLESVYGAAPSATRQS